jgi:hypothetical protein
LLCDGVVGDYVLEIYESRLNYVNEKEVNLENEEIKRIKKEKDGEIKRIKEENKKKDEEIERIREEKEKEKKEKDEEIKKQHEEIEKLKEEKEKKEILEGQKQKLSSSSSSLFPQQTLSPPHEQKSFSQQTPTLYEQKSFPQQNIFASASASISNLKKEIMNKKGFFLFLSSLFLCFYLFIFYFFLFIFFLFLRYDNSTNGPYHSKPTWVV